MRVQLKWGVTCALLIILACVHVACKGKDTGDGAQKSPLAETDTAALIDQARRGEVISVDENQINEIIESFKGEKVVLLNFWATWCVPCVEEFPDLVKLHQRYHAKGLEVIAVSADSPKEVESKIKPFLKKRDAKFLGFVKDTKDDGAFIDAISKEWGGELPTTFIYAKSGQRVKSFHGKQNLDTFAAAIEPLLN